MTRSYNAARREHAGAPVTFNLTNGDDVTEFECKGSVSSLLLSEFARNADVDMASPEGMALVADFFRQAFGDEKEYRRFFRYVVDNGVDDEVVMDVLGGLVQDFVGRPTKPRSGSPGSRSKSGKRSKAVSSQRVVKGEVAGS